MSNLIAHRGLDNKKYKENTKLAIIDSLKKDYIKGIEIDIRMTKDKKLVLNHDMSINRISNGSGLIKNMTLKELKKYNFGTKENPCKISTLKEILKILPKDKIILIEIKYDRNENYNNFIKHFYNTISKYINKNLYIASFNEEIIKRLKKLHPNLNCGLFISKIINSEHLNDSFDFMAVSSYNINKFKNYDKPIFIWALKSKEKYLELKNNQNNNTFYIVDYPYKFI